MTAAWDPNHDEACIAIYLAGDVRGFVDLVERYERALLSFATKILNDAAGAEDMVQEALIVLATGVEALANRKAFRTWIFRITYFKCLERLKVLRREKDAGVFAITPSTVIVDPRTVRPAEDTATQMRLLLDRLNPGDRALLELRFAEGFSIAEVAEATDTPLATVRKRIYRLRKTLKDLLESNPPERGNES